MSLPPAAKGPSGLGRTLSAGFKAAAVAGLLFAAYVASGLVRGGAAIDEPMTAAVQRGELAIDVAERGELESAESVDVKCDVEGAQIKLVSILPEGTAVKKGMEVCRFDAEPLQKSFAEQQVKWKQAAGKSKAAYSELEVQKNKSESEVAKAKLNLTLAELDRDMYEEGEYRVEKEDRAGAIELAQKELKEAQDNLEFTRNLAKKGFVQMEQVRVRELEVQTKTYIVKRDEQKMRVLDKFIKRRKMTEFTAKAEDAKRELDRTEKSQRAANEKAAADADAANETAKLEKQQLERVESQIGRCLVKAPADGILVYFKRFWDEDSRIRPGAMLYYQQTIFSLPDLAKMKAKVKVHESMIKRVKAGQVATLTIDAFAERPLQGKVTSVGTLAVSEGWRSGSVKEYLIEIDIVNLPLSAGLKPGMTGEVKIHIEKVKDSLYAPVQAVTELEGQRYAYVVAGGKIERRPVEIGASNERFVQIVSGLSEGERVALDARSRAAAEAKKSDEKSKKPAAPAPTQPGTNGSAATPLAKA
ncbi:MAG TPA: efflux RND transporter periplasmic adaptor subunit [Planctomycetia bacterium]|nr:efflux RND transporter periplasmic adaptor subunit [Planctomycetia bacterium]